MRKQKKKERGKEIVVEVTSVQDHHLAIKEIISKKTLKSSKYQVDRIKNMRNKLTEQINKINEQGREM